MILFHSFMSYRMQQNQEREEALHNLEYLKNVIIKVWLIYLAFLISLYCVMSAGSYDHNLFSLLGFKLVVDLLAKLPVVATDYQVSYWQARRQGTASG